MHIAKAHKHIDIHLVRVFTQGIAKKITVPAFLPSWAMIAIVMQFFFEYFRNCPDEKLFPYKGEIRTASQFFFRNLAVKIANYKIKNQVKNEKTGY